MVADALSHSEEAHHVHWASGRSGTMWEGHYRAATVDVDTAQRRQAYQTLFEEFIVKPPRTAAGRSAATGSNKRLPSRPRAAPRQCPGGAGRRWSPF